MNQTFLRSWLATSMLSAILVAGSRAQDSVEGYNRVGKLQDTLAAPASVCDDTPGDPCSTFNLRLTQSAPGWETSAAILFLQPASGNLVYATLISPFPFLTPNWIDQAVRPGFNPAFNIATRYIFGSGCDVQLSWTQLNSFDHASAQGNPTPVVTPAGIFAQQALGPSFLIGPPPPFTSASATAHFLYDAINLDGGMLVSAGKHARMRLFAGLQGAYISQSLATNFLSPDSSISFNNISKSAFSGVGPRLGMDLHYVAGHFDFLGGIAGTTLIGGMQSHADFLTYSPANNAVGLSPNTEFINAPNTTRIVPGIDARLGASYAIPVGRLGAFRCEAGYQAAVYFNVINQFSLTEVENTAVAPSEGSQAVFLRTAVESQSNFVVHGPYARISLQF